MIDIVNTVIKHTKEEGQSIINRNSSDLRNNKGPVHFQLGILIT
jgi:hypothetical protein